MTILLGTEYLSHTHQLYKTTNTIVSKLCICCRRLLYSVFMDSH